MSDNGGVLGWTKHSEAAPKTTTTGTKTKTKRSITGHAYRTTRIRLVEVSVNYLQDGECGAVSVIGDDYETARDQAFDLMPERAVRLSIMVDRDL